MIRSRHAMLLCLISLVVLGAESCNRQPAVHIPLTMKKYEFVPSEIHVRRGQRVVLEITTADVQHGFHVGDWDINEPVQKGKVTEVEFEAQQPGEHKMNCSIICGPMHDEMTGKIVVE